MNLFGHEQEMTTSDDYYTPAWVFEDMAVEFDMDVASPPGGVPWIPARRFLTMADDGLTSPWEGKVWMNPPFSGARHWVKRFMEYGNGIALLPMARSNWLNDIWDTGDPLVLLPKVGSFVFVGGTVSYGCFLWGRGGDWAVEAIGRVGHVR